MAGASLACVSTSPAYLDAASSEPLHPAAADALRAAAEQAYADPRRLHHDGRRARQVLDNARAVVAQCLGVRPDEVTFTPSGTHAVHLGLLGLLQGRPGSTVTTSAVEHLAVRHALAWAGASVHELAVDPTGRIDAAEAAGRSGVLALQAANHEVGTLQPVTEAGEVFDGPVFVDACAAVGRVPLPHGWSVLAGSAHKWGGPAGVGVLVIRKGARWRQPFPGDDRIDERAVGFDNVAAAFASAAALQAVTAEQASLGQRQHALVARIRDEVAARIPDVDVVGHPDLRLPHLVTFSCLYVDGEALVTDLDRAGYAVASGSACAASTLEPSHVLAAMGALTHGNVRVSLTRETTAEDVEGLLDALPGVVADIRARVGM